MNSFCTAIRYVMRYEYRLYRLYCYSASHAPNRRVRCLMLRYARYAKKHYWVNRHIYERYCLLQNGNNNVVEE